MKLTKEAITAIFELGFSVGEISSLKCQLDKDFDKEEFLQDQLDNVLNIWTK